MSKHNTELERWYSFVPKRVGKSIFIQENIFFIKVLPRVLFISSFSLNKCFSNKSNKQVILPLNKSHFEAKHSRILAFDLRIMRCIQKLIKFYHHKFSCRLNYYAPCNDSQCRLRECARSPLFSLGSLEAFFGNDFTQKVCWEQTLKTNCRGPRILWVMAADVLRIPPAMS